MIMTVMVLSRVTVALPTQLVRNLWRGRAPDVL